MKTFRIMCAALVAAMTLASCQKEQAGKDNGLQQPKSITISLSNVKVPTKLSSTTVLNTGSTATVNDFQVFLTDGANFYDGLNVDGTPAAHFITVDTDNPSASLTQTFHFVDPNVTQVMIVANLGSEQTFANVTALKAFSVEIADQQDDKIDNLILFGEDTSLDNTGNHATQHPATEIWTAEVPIAPLIARIEVVNFSTKFAQNSAYKSVTVNKLAFNDYYRSTNLGGVNSSRMNEDITASNVYSYLNGLTGTHWYYDNLDLSHVEDGIQPVTMTKLNATEHVVAADMDHHYAYHFFPSLTATEGIAEGYPQLVVGATAVDNQDRVTEQYLATNSFTGTGFSGFKQGEIYRVEFAFADSSLDHQLKCIDVQVSVKPWTVITLTPNL